MGLLTLSSAAATTAPTVPGAGKPVLRIGVQTPPASPDPNKAAYWIGYTLTYEAPMLAPLQGEGDEFLPGLATAWRYLKPAPRSGRKNKDFEFTLRRNARFSDGARVTASAVVGSLNYYYNKAGGPFAQNLGPNPRFEAIDRWTVQIHLQTPTPGIPSILFQVPISAPRAVADPTLFASGSHGAGPYMLDPSQSVTGDHYTLVPNPYFFDKKRIKWSKVELKVIATPASRLQALQAGQLDVAPGDVSTAAAAAQAGIAVVRSGRSSASYALIVLDAKGFKVKALSDVRVRRALNYAINRKAIAASLVGKFGGPTSEILTKNGFVPELLNHYPYDPARAKALLAAAGFASGLSVEFLGASYAGIQGAPLAQAIARDLEAVGVDVNLKLAATFGEFLQGAIVDPRPMWLNPGTGVTIMSTLYSLVMKPGAVSNSLGGGWSDPVINGLRVKGLRSSDNRYWQMITDRFTKQAYGIPTVWVAGLYYVNAKKVKGVAYGEWGVDPNQWSPAQS